MGAHALDRDLAELADSARAALVREIDASGAWAADPGWREAFEAVPRHLFVPYYYVGVMGGYERRWGESPDPRAREKWVRGAYADAPLATRLRDGELVSSSSQPSLMAMMLAELRVRNGDRVLEIGAGTGYNAALLAHRLGDDRVTTVDLEPEITEAARGHLAAAGYHPAVVTGDGARGVPERAPFDRIIATCTLAKVPTAWLAQCRPGALILSPLATGLIALTVRDAGHAQGRFLHTPAYFVPLRGTGRPDPEPAELGGVPRPARENELFRFLLALSRGSLEPEEAHALWKREGQPRRERYGITVSGDREWAWLDDPEGPYAWPLR
ncbi:MULTISPECIES: methyltransferase domain-containing protein [unclassified Streptomyces]|uniref:methyltransferase domain-containing protein n=1 Tax=unclassified Streptomyces TaxID=2593676 RepID=UPI001BAE8D81|nr:MULTISPECIES: methyltransferase domain-containing protein [unclassified Streptomyces]MDH6450264.1 protein-L-isoaspartate O-methyltransferase [Streptomyces sp. SAI-119]MDH6499193.1 protein-L-isoaspartate O-methyltransferase [Streptomyces sp. SAI-149]QUC62043.1 methyltransferase domain-containing protein [Streptomyces sp. A2-16]